MCVFSQSVVIVSSSCNLTDYRLCFICVRLSVLKGLARLGCMSFTNLDFNNQRSAYPLQVSIRRGVINDRILFVNEKVLPGNAQEADQWVPGPDEEEPAKKTATRRSSRTSSKRKNTNSRTTKKSKSSTQTKSSGRGGTKKGGSKRRKKSSDKEDGKSNDKEEKGKPPLPTAGLPRSHKCGHPDGTIKLYKWATSGNGMDTFCTLCHVCFAYILLKCYLYCNLTAF